MNQSRGTTGKTRLLNVKFRCDTREITISKFDIEIVCGDSLKCGSKDSEHLTVGLS